MIRVTRAAMREALRLTDNVRVAEHFVVAATPGGDIAPEAVATLNKMPEPTEQWSSWNHGRSHLLYPASEAALFKVRVEINACASSAQVIVSPKENPSEQSGVKLELHFAVDGYTTDAEVAELRRKAKLLAQRLLKRQAALL